MEPPSGLTIESLQKARASLAEYPQPEFIEAEIGGVKLPSAPMRWTMKPSVDPKRGLVMLDVQDYAGRITQEIMRTKEEAIREALIALGWTPPDKALTSEEIELIIHALDCADGEGLIGNPRLQYLEPLKEKLELCQAH